MSAHVARSFGDHAAPTRLPYRTPVPGGITRARCWKISGCSAKTVWRRKIWTIVLVVLLPGLAAAATGAESDRGRRLVRQFDFEETIDGRKVGHYEKLPVHWYVMGRETGIEDAAFTQVPMHHQFVHGTRKRSWGEVAYDGAKAFAGDFSMRLSLNGGSVGAFLRVGAMPAIPGSDYSVTAAVRTTPMEHARAHIAACFVDGAGRIIEASVVRSPPLQTHGKWQRATVRLGGNFERANWISIQVELNQPSPASDIPLGKRQVVYHQVHGSAWFDDVSVWQLPRLRIATQSPVNIVRMPQEPELSVEVTDFSRRRLMAEIEVVDHLGRQAATWRQSMGGNTSPHRRWVPELPRYGWYLVNLLVREHGSFDGVTQDPGPIVAQTRGSFHWLPEERPIEPSQRQRFHVFAEHLESDQMHLLPQLLVQAGVGATVVSAWDRATTTGDVEARQLVLAEMFAQIMQSGGDVTLSLSPIPDDVARGLDVDTDDPVSLLNESRRAWFDLLRPVVIQHGPRVSRWQLGSVGSEAVFFRRNAGTMADEASRQMFTMAPSPKLRLPWSLLHEYREDIPEVYGYVLDVPASVQPAWIGRHLQPWSARATTPVTVHLQAPSSADLSHDQRCTDLALRMISAWQAGVDGLAITRPWSAVGSLERQWMPDPRMGVFSTVAHRLAGRRWRGSLNLGAGLACEIFEGTGNESDGLLAVWNVSAPASRLDQTMFLGPNPVAIDLFGNANPLRKSEGGHHFRLAKTPIFIEGIDPKLAQLRASFAVEPPFLESKQMPHNHTITLSNPWSYTISGELRITGPDQWMIEPRRQHFSIASGQNMRAEMTIMFPVSEVAGAKKLVARASFTADVPYEVTLEAPMTLGLRDVDFGASVLLESNPTTGQIDAVVTQMITNKSDETIALYAFASMLGHPRQERIVPKLLAGQVIVRRFRFAAAGSGGPASHVRVGLRETAGPAVLNRILPLVTP